jgi:DNA topoisomerase-1
MSRPRVLTSLHRNARNRSQNRALSASSVVSATTAGLRYVSDQTTGIRRHKGRRGFKYTGPDGKVIRNRAELKRIAALAVPPAWTDVWICTHPRGHLQATGRDAKGRKQYRYHHDWRATRDETKFDRMQGFAGALPTIRRRTRADLARPGLPRDKVLATIVQLLEKSLIRVGNEEYVKQNQSFGLTTLRNRHVRVSRGTLRFEFRGKSGIRHSVDVNDRHLAQVVKQCRDLPGQELFQYVNDDGDLQPVDSGDINGYLKDVTGEDFTAKDFRTWSGTVLAVTALREFVAAETKTQAEKNVVLAIEAVARLLGNTRTVCRKSYVHPGIVDCYVDRSMEKVLGRLSKAARKNRSGLRAEEVAVVALLRYLQSREPGKRKAA